MLAALTRSAALSRCRPTGSLFTAAVVDARYCAPRETAFTARETWFDGFPVKDNRGATVMRAEQAAFSFPRRHRLLDVSSAGSRRTVLTVERSPTLFEVRRRWKVYSGNSTCRSDLLFVAVEAPLFTRGDVHVHLAGRGDRDPDFVVDARGFFSREYTVRRGAGGGAALARIDRTLTLLDVLFDMLAYSVRVNAGVDRAFVVALTVILSEISHDDVRRRRERNRNSR